jgi:predicted N-acetyltransferase YhbS
MQIAEESWAEFAREALPLMAQHNAELGEASPNQAFEVDQEQAQALAAAGALVILTARESGILIGYIIWFLSFNLGFKGQLNATQGPWFVKPEWRNSSAGLRLFNASLDSLRERGVQNVFAHHWAKSPDLGPFFARKGGKLMEVVYSIWIGK